jgi:hypothetical protein
MAWSPVGGKLVLTSSPGVGEKDGKQARQSPTRRSHLYHFMISRSLGEVGLVTPCSIHEG